MNAIGERVSDRRQGKCAGVQSPGQVAPPISRSEIPKEGGKASIPDILKHIRPSSSRVPPRTAHQSPPGWIMRIPSRSGVLYGVGQDRTLLMAFRRASTVIAGQLQVHIRSVADLEQSEHTTTTNGKSDTSSRTYVAESSQMIISGIVDEIKIADQYNTNTGTTWVLASLDLAALRRRQDVLVTSVLRTIERAASRLSVTTTKKHIIDQTALFELIGVLEDVKALGRSNLGRSVRHRWRGQFYAFRRLVERIIECVHVTSGYRTNGKLINTGPCPKISDGTVMELALSCNNLSLANGRFETDVTGGITAIPAVLESDANGRIRVPLGAIYGQGEVKVGFTHSLRGVDGAHWIKNVRPSNRASICFEAHRPATIGIRITGSPNEFARKVQTALETFVARRWGAQIVQAQAPLQMVVRLDFGNVSSAMGKFAVPLTIRVAVNSTQGKLFAKTRRVGSVGDTADQAKAQVLANLLRDIQRW